MEMNQNCFLADIMNEDQVIVFFVFYLPACSERDKSYKLILAIVVVIRIPSQQKNWAIATRLSMRHTQPKAWKVVIFHVGNNYCPKC